jgi:hypothetical protein
LLHLYRTSHRPINAIEYDEERVASCLKDPATVFVDRGIDEGAPQRPQSRERSFVVTAYEAAVADDVSMNDGDGRWCINRLTH